MAAKAFLLLAVAVLLAPGADAAVKKVLTAGSGAAPPVIDGDLSDPAWVTAGLSSGFSREADGTATTRETTAYALSDTEHLYLGFRCQESDPASLRARVTEDNASIWGDDCVAFKLDATGGSPDILELVMNSMGTKELFRQPGGHLALGGIRVAAHVGTAEWTLECAIPFAALGIARAPEVEMRWRVNFEHLHTVGKRDNDHWQFAGTEWDNPEQFGTMVIPGGDFLVGPLSVPMLKAGAPSNASLTLASHGSQARRLKVSLSDMTDGQVLCEEVGVLGPAASLEVPLPFRPPASGDRQYRCEVRDAETGSLLYCIEKTVAVGRSVRLYPFYHSREVLVDAEVSPWGVAAGPDLQAELLPTGSESVLCVSAATPLANEPVAHAILRVGDLSPGDYRVRVSAKGTGGESLEPVITERITWPASPSWPGAPSGLRVLNNFVTELLNVRPGAGSEQRYKFWNPRDGWVFIASSAQVGEGGQLRLTLDGARPEDALILQDSGGSAVAEAMRELPAGDHTLRLEQSGTCRPQRLIVRAIPEMVFCKFGYDPHMKPYGPYDWSFLKRNVCPHVTTIVGSGERAPATEWRQEGRKWIFECPLLGTSGKPVAVEDVEQEWLTRASDPACKPDGIIVDEFGSENDNYPVWEEALRRLHRNPGFQGLSFYPYSGSLWEGKDATRFLRTVLEYGDKFAWERYLEEQPTESKAREVLKEMLSDEMPAWEKALPGCVRDMIVCFSYLCAPPESQNIYPNVHYKAWMDMQYRWLANDPSFWGVAGVMEYTCGYADEEAVRWAARLYRHYCIEGNTQPLCRDPYIQAHIENGDFADGLTCWQVEPAGADSITAGSMAGYSWLEGRYPQTTVGDTFLLMRRSAAKPNVVSQTIKGLVPGRLYSLKMFTGDHQDLSVKEQHAVSISIEGVQVIRRKSFQFVYPNLSGHLWGRYDQPGKAWMNFYFEVFRAQGSEALLRISDWKSPQDPGGRNGQELMFNFVEVEPYLP
jgi:hypothetical protein